ncbi:MAG: hypothetical protein ABIU05_20790 [Nitrospirales bacterium]
MRSRTLFAACLIFSMGSVASQVNAQEICRTAGFWGTHAGEEKSGSTNISEEVIRAWLSTVNSYDQTATDKCTYNNIDGTVSCDFEPPGQAGSPKACRDAKKNDITLLNNFPIGYEGINICGQIVSVDPNGLAQIPSVVEALCVSPGGDSKLQLGRQLTAAALNCLLSGGGSDCTGTSIEPVFASCNSTCADSNQEEHVNTCIEKLDCFNNGGAWNEDDPQAMYCQMDAVESCHDQPLIGTVMNGSGEPEDPQIPQ